MPPLSIILIWHFHQPWYGSPDGGFRLPWARLHATKDYLSMVRMARMAGMRCTFNVVPSLLEQLDAYRDGANDPHLQLTSAPADSLSDDQRGALCATAFLGHPPTMIDPHPRFHALRESTKRGDRLSVQDARDLQVWSNLAWVAPMLREEPVWTTLFTKQRDFTEDDKAALFDEQRRICGAFADELRAAHGEGLIEVSFTPYYHPILPLLCDTDVARDPNPHAVLPSVRFAHPEDAAHQIRSGREYVARRLGVAPRGMWPSEGSVSEEVARIAADLGVRWMASDEAVLRRSLERVLGHDAVKREDVCCALFRPHRHPPDSGPAIFFRDHALSDRIGFVYSTWSVREAVADFSRHLSDVRATLDEHGADPARHCVAVILDGENAWEFYRANGEPFISSLYESLMTSPDFAPTTPSAFLDRVEPEPLPRLAAGSWIDGDFAVWLGHPEDRKAVELLAVVRALVAEQERIAGKTEALARAWRSIYIAEGSDWTWWYGDEHSTPDDAVFDELYRAHLSYALSTLGLEVLDELKRPIGQAGLRRTVYSLPRDLLSPTLDGRDTWYFEWATAGRFACGLSGAAMHRVDRVLSEIMFGYDAERFYVRLDFEGDVPKERQDALKFVLEGRCNGRREVALEDDAGVRCVRGVIVEAAVPYSALGIEPPCELAFRVRVEEGGRVVETWPEEDEIRVNVLGTDLLSEAWIA